MQTKNLRKEEKAFLKKTLMFVALMTMHLEENDEKSLNSDFEEFRKHVKGKEELMYTTFMHLYPDWLAFSKKAIRDNYKKQMWKRSN